ncbi:MAG: hypothetical protein GYA47_08485 [Desulfovibrio sp.]|nr:hypothetical protein [Desulfovibrio sp.]
MSGQAESAVEVVERPVPMRVLRAAEAQALAWKKRAEELSRAIKEAAAAGVSVGMLMESCRKIMAGVE